MEITLLKFGYLYKNIPFKWHYGINYKDFVICLNIFTLLCFELRIQFYFLLVLCKTFEHPCLKHEIASQWDTKLLLNIYAPLDIVETDNMHVCTLVYMLHW